MASVSHLWINHTGCDSPRSTVADASTAYFGGHERCAGNPTRDRGLGADDMLLTSAGPWIASDNSDRRP